MINDKWRKGAEVKEVKNFLNYQEKELDILI
jgi:hypothetical protein